MDITIKDLEERFIEYNQLYFNGKLKMPKFYINRWFCGIYGSYGHDKDGSPLISIRNNKGAKITEEELKDTLIHEMLHYYMDKNWFLRIDSACHLLCWQLVRIYMNLKYGLHITTYPKKRKKRPMKNKGRSNKN